ncbi:MAG TPA: fused MFS/spermidine synthase [Candidatus Polarisedimenticolia bacterium]|nr:fused MFS/spermidine synthase [Candidatus Polarisedimenticolia bacterium]
MVVFALSGAAGLIHEVVWARLLGLVFGATSLAISTVLAAFMGGLALGSWWLGRRVSRIQNRPRLYALLEIGIGAFALLIPFLLDVVEPFYGWIWRQFQFSFAVFSILRFFVAGAILLAPTIMMGATLPLLSDYLAGLEGRRVPPQWLYTANLLGAVLGVAAGGFILMPAFGVWGTVVAGAAANICVGLAVLGLPGLKRRRTQHGGAPSAQPEVAAAPPDGAALLFAAALLSGVTSLAAQVAWTRVLVLVVGSTTYAFSTVLLVYLIALALGSAWSSYRAARLKDFGSDLAIVHVLMALGMLCAVLAVNGLPSWYVKMFQSWHPGSLIGIVALNAAVVFALLIVPVFFAGTILPLAMAGALPAGGRGTGRAVGGIYALNTIGAIVGAVMGGFVLVPLLGSENTLLAIALVSAGMGLVFAWSGGRPRRLAHAATVACAILVVGVWLRPEWGHQALNAGVFETGRAIEGQVSDPGDRVLFHKEGPTATVMVLQTATNYTYMRINGRINASDGPKDMTTQVLVAQIPLLLAPHDDDVFIIGLGSGVTAGSALQSPARRLTVVELEPAVVEASRYFSHVNLNPLGDPRLILHRDDARHILFASPEMYDVIISEPSHPWISGIANLFTQDFFEMASHRLKEGGIFAQWLQTYQISYDSFRTLLATFQSVFPEVMVFRSRGTDTILVGSHRPLRLDLADLDRRWADHAVRAENARIGIARPEHLLATLYTGPADVRAIVAGIPLNTDDNMRVEFRAPREMIAKANVATRQIFELLDRTPAEAALAEPSTLLGSQERIQALVDGLTAMRRSADRYRAMLPNTGGP